MSVWPAPVVRLIRGDIGLEATIAAASDPDPDKAKEQLCEARFYGAQARLANGAKDEAAPLFRQAVADCPQFSTERAAATAELRALGADP